MEAVRYSAIIKTAPVLWHEMSSNGYGHSATDSQETVMEKYRLRRALQTQMIEDVVVAARNSRLVTRDLSPEAYNG